MTEPNKWVSVEALAEAFQPGSFAPQPTVALEGQPLTLWLEDGSVLEHRLLAGGGLEWRALAGPGTGARGTGTASVFALRDALYLIDYVRSDEPGTAVSIVADLGEGIATLVIGRVPAAEARESWAERIKAGQELTPVTAEFLSASLRGPFTPETRRHLPTSDLIGKRIEYTYSASERYEHIYLNERFYTWHCLAGLERGLADTDRCHYLKLADDLYLFVWREKIVPTLGLVVLDLRQMRTTGKIFGGQPPGRRPVNFVVGAQARLLNVTTYGPERTANG